jgi:RES domain-containing protein
MTEGARRAGGRWNSKGTPVLYMSENRSLAVLEVLVHLSGTLSDKYFLGTADSGRLGRGERCR